MGLDDLKPLYGNSEQKGGGSVVKNLPAMQEIQIRSPGLGRSTGERNGYPFQYSCLEKYIDRGAWQATVHGVAKSQI